MDRKTATDLLRGRNHPNGLTGAYGQRVSANLRNPGRPAKVPDVPRLLTLSTAGTNGEVVAQWWSEGPNVRSHWYVTPEQGSVLVTFRPGGEVAHLSTVV